MNKPLPIEIARKKKELLGLLDEVIDLTQRLDRLFKANEAVLCDPAREFKNAA